MDNLASEVSRRSQKKLTCALGRFAWLRAGRRQTERGASACGFDADPIVDGGTNALHAAQVSLGRLNGDVPEEELNLLQFAARGMTQPGTRSADMPHAACCRGF